VGDPPITGFSSGESVVMGDGLGGQFLIGRTGLFLFLCFLATLPLESILWVSPTGSDVF